jgi:hypothetical protein
MPLRGRKTLREGAGLLPATRQERLAEGGAACGKEVKSGYAPIDEELGVIALVVLLLALAVS